MLIYEVSILIIVIIVVSLVLIFRFFLSIKPLGQYQQTVIGPCLNNYKNVVYECVGGGPCLSDFYQVLSYKTILDRVKCAPNEQPTNVSVNVLDDSNTRQKTIETTGVYNVPKTYINLGTFNPEKFRVGESRKLPSGIKVERGVNEWKLNDKKESLENIFKEDRIYKKIIPKKEIKHHLKPKVKKIQGHVFSSFCSNKNYLLEEGVLNFNQRGLDYQKECYYIPENFEIELSFIKIQNKYVLTLKDKLILLEDPSYLYRDYSLKYDISFEDYLRKNSPIFWFCDDGSIFVFAKQNIKGWLSENLTITQNRQKVKLEYSVLESFKGTGIYKEPLNLIIQRN